METAVIADDLTGANDSGLGFAARGLDTRVFLRQLPQDLQAGMDVAVVDVETRGMTGPDARHVVEDVAACLCRQGAQRLFKKVDSTMRGPVGWELAGALAGSGATFIVFTPAFPAAGRVVEEGVLLVNGTPVNQTAFALDPATPVLESDLRSLLDPGLDGVACLSIPRTMLDDPAAVADLLRSEHRRCDGQPVCGIFDCQDRADLNQIVQVGRILEDDLAGSVLWSGSAGLAEVLLPASGAEAVGVPVLSDMSSAPPLLVVGSVHPVSLGQLAEVAETLSAHPVVLSPDILLTRDRAVEIAWGVSMLTERRAAGDKVLVLATSDSAEDGEQTPVRAQAEGLSKVEIGQRIADGLARVVATLLDLGAVDRLVLTGGETARAVMEAAGLGAGRVLGAIEPGIPLVATLDEPRRLMITKAGGFGGPDSLARAVTYLIEGRLSS